MKPQRPKVDPIRNPTLFQKEELDETDESPNSLTVERPYSEPGLCLGTSAFTAKGWEGSFYPKGMRSADYLAFYAQHFHTVEVDSTFYGCPSVRPFNNWAHKPPMASYSPSKSHGSSRMKKRWWTATLNLESSSKRWLSSVQSLVLCSSSFRFSTAGNSRSKIIFSLCWLRS